MITSTFSTADWWIAAVVSGIACGVALQAAFATTRRQRLRAAAPPLAGAVAIFLDSVARGYDVQTPLMLYTVAMLGLTVTMAIFTRYLKRQMALVRSGKPMERATPKHVSIFLFTCFVVTLSMAAVL